MASFKDANGDRWHVPVTVGTLMSIKDELELNLLDEPDKMPQDVEGILSIIWVCVRAQAKDKGLSLDDFAELLDGESINAACEAWMQGYVDFFCHLQPARGQALKAIWLKGKEMQAAQVDQISQALSACLGLQV